ncbi:MAG: succinate dehydrogenase, cytochrome b556 subunit [Thiomicrorhabdus sp.]|nr:succinate dehydrogenase, cytochrome b556 subunit [Thiomicrorhabdus sp.]
MYSHPGNRPRFLSLSAFRFPLNTKLSALHRITGLLLIISLLGYLALFQLILFHPTVTIENSADHWVHNLLYSGFWSTLSFHWLTGLRHLLAEHFINPQSYQRINKQSVSYALISLWLLITLFIIYQAWWNIDL